MWGALRQTLVDLGHPAHIIPPRSNREAPEHPDYHRYKDRNRIERMFGKLKQQRRIAPLRGHPATLRAARA